MTTPPNVTLAHLYALRGHLDAVILAVETEAGVTHLPPLEPGSCQKCGAPPEQVDNTSTLDGIKRRRCGQCGEEWEVPVSESR